MYDVKTKCKNYETHEGFFLSTVFDLYCWLVCASLLDDLERILLDVGLSIGIDEFAADETLHVKAGVMGFIAASLIKSAARCRMEL